MVPIQTDYLGQFFQFRIGDELTFTLSNISMAKVDKSTGCLKKMSFAELSICRFAMKIVRISSQVAAGSLKARFRVY